MNACPNTHAVIGAGSARELACCGVSQVPSRDGRTVLCVDDEPNVLHSLRRLLRKEPYTLLTAESPEAALAILERQPVQVIVADQRMPGMNGSVLLQKVATLYPDIVRIMLSGYSELQALMDAVNQGHIFRFLTKPWNDEDLTLTIRQCLQHHELSTCNRRLSEQIRAQCEDLRCLNEQLEKMVTERSQILDLTREMLQRLPLPVIGVGRDGVIAFTNEAVRRSTVSLQKVALGEDASDVLPGQLVKYIEECMNQGCRPMEFIDHLDHQRLRFQIEPLGNPSNPTGCLLIVTVHEGASPLMGVTAP